MKSVKNKQSGASPFFGSLKVCLAACMMLLMTQTAQAESFNFNMRDGDISTLVDTVSKVTGKNFVLDGNLNLGEQKITVISNNLVDTNDIYDMFLSVLQVHGLSAVEAGKITKVIPSNKSKYQSTPFFSGEALETELAKLKSDELITATVKVKHIPVAQLVPILRPMISPVGHLQGYTPSNSLLVSDSASNVMKVAEIAKSLDQPEKNDMELVAIEYALAADVAAVIQGLNEGSQKAEYLRFKLSVDERTNSLLIQGSDSTREHLKEIIRGLDQEREEPTEESEASESEM